MASSNALAIFLLRHTETTWNTESRYQGRIDTALSDSGMRQALAISDLMGPGDLRAIYSSPLSRARTLAELLAKRAEAPLVVDERLTEIAMGPWEGLYRRQIEQRYAGMLHAWAEHPDTVQFPGGENLQDVALRMDEFMRELFATNREGGYAVVSHDTVIKVALMLSMGLDLRYLHRFRMRNGSVSVLRGRSFLGSVETIDSTSHLTGSPFRLSPP